MAPRLITLFEHQEKKYADIFTDPQQKRSLDQILSEIDQVNHAAGHDLLTLRRDRLRAGSWIGIIRAGEIIFQVLPKIDYLPARTINDTAQQTRLHNKKYPPENSAIENLIYLLAYAFDIQIDEQQLIAQLEQETTWFDLLALFFARQLGIQIMTGLSQEFLTKEEKGPTLHGRWDFQHQIKEGGINPTEFHVLYEQQTADTSLNQVFKFVLDRLILLVTNQETKNLLIDLSFSFSEVTLQNKILPEHIQSIHFHRLNERYAPAFSLACMVLSGDFINPIPGRRQSPAFMMDMNVLFERFIAGFLKVHWKAIFRQRYSEISLTSQSEGRTIYLASVEGKKKIRLKPDLLLTINGASDPALIADTKYKQINQKGNGILAEDIYQMIAYAVQLKCSKLMLIYPQSSRSTPIRQIYQIPSLGAMIFITTVSLHIPLKKKELFIDELSEIFNQGFV